MSGGPKQRLTGSMTATQTTKLPEGWRRVAVKDVATSIQYGHTASAIERKDGPRFLRITDIQNGSVDWGAVPSCDIPDEDIPKYRLLPGDLVFARTGATTGKSFLIGECPEAVFASYLIRVRVSADVNARYLATFFQSPDYWQQVEGGKRGIGQPNVNGKVLGEIQFPLPPIKEQHLIVAEIEKQFTCLDAGVAALRRVQANLKRYRAAVLKAACEGKLVPIEAELSRSRPSRKNCQPTYETGEQLLQRILAERRKNWTGKGKYKEPAAPDTSNLPRLPMGWEWATIEQIADIGSGNTVAGMTARLHTAGEIPWFKVGDMNAVANRISMQTTDAWFSRPDANVLGLRIFPVGTILFPKRGGAIATNKKRRLCVEATADANVMGLTPDPALAEFFWWWFQTVDLAGLSDGSNVPQVNNKDILPLYVPLPPLAEQTRIVAEVQRRLSIVEELEAIVNANLQRAARLRQSILQKAFTGQLA